MPIDPSNMFDNDVTVGTTIAPPYAVLSLKVWIRR